MYCKKQNRRIQNALIPDSDESESEWGALGSNLQVGTVFVRPQSVLCSYLLNAIARLFDPNFIDVLPSAFWQDGSALQYVSQ